MNTLIRLLMLTCIGAGLLPLLAGAQRGPVVEFDRLLLERAEQRLALTEIGTHARFLFLGSSQVEETLDCADCNKLNASAICPEHLRQESQAIADYWDGKVPAGAEYLRFHPDDAKIGGKEVLDGADEGEVLKQIQPEPSGAAPKEDIIRGYIIFYIAQVAQHHPRVANPEIFEFFSAVLQEDSPWQCRAAAAFALGYYPDKSRSVPVLLDFLEKINETTNQKRKEVQGNLTELEDAFLYGDFDEDLVSLKLHKQLNAKLEELQPDRLALLCLQVQWRLAMTSVGRIRDDRCTNALLVIAEGWKVDKFPNYMVDAFLNQPTHDRVQAVLHNFKVLSGRVDSYDRAYEKTRKLLKTPRMPRTFLKGKPLWVVLFGAARRARIQRLLGLRGDANEALDTLHKRLGAWCTRQGFPVPAIRHREYYRSWRQWLVQHKRKLPNRLVDLSSGK